MPGISECLLFRIDRKRGSIVVGLLYPHFNMKTKIVVFSVGSGINQLV